MCKKIASENYLKMHVCHFGSFSILITVKVKQVKFSRRLDEMEKSSPRAEKVHTLHYYRLRNVNDLAAILMSI